MEQVSWGRSDGASEAGTGESEVPWAQDFSPAWDVNRLMPQKTSQRLSHGKAPGASVE